MRVPNSRSPRSRGTGRGRPTPKAAKRPHIYGSETRFKATIGRHISQGAELLDLVEGIRRRAGGTEGEVMTLLAYAREMEWCDSVERWRRKAIASAEKHLADKAEAVLPLLTAAWPPNTGKPRHRRTITRVEPWLRGALEELRALRNLLGVSRNVAALASPGRFAELQASGLVDELVIAGLAKEMVDPKTPKQLADAIGAAKDLTEATLRAALDRLQVSWGKDDGLQQLMRKWRDETAAAASPNLAARGMLDRAQAALANLVAFLNEWRNEYGRGHGRPRYAVGLRRRHARLATDAAETAIRFIVATMDDTSRLPPR